MSQPTADQLHIDGYVGPDRRKKKRRKGEAMAIDEVRKLEEVILKRDFSADERKKLAAEGKALGDGSYPMPDTDTLRRAAILARSGHGDASAAKALIARRAKALGVKNPLESDTSKSEVAIEVRLIKGDFEGKVWGIVLEPELPDSQGDNVTEGDIEKACHAHMREALAPDVQHSGRDAGAVLIENFVAPVDFTLHGADGPTEVRKGSWVQAYEIDDPVVKEEVRTGKLTGLSMEGTGIRLPLAA